MVAKREVVLANFIMPHMIVEYSANLENRIDIDALCDSLWRALKANPIFPLGGIRVRAYKAEIYRIADCVPENAFIALTLRIGAGRTKQQITDAGNKIFVIASEFCAELFKEPNFALSFEINEINENASWKKNSIHSRLKNNA